MYEVCLERIKEQFGETEEHSCFHLFHVSITRIVQIVIFEVHVVLQSQNILTSYSIVLLVSIMISMIEGFC